jgi:class 3 adenylate cyclase/tetratricopeptide (TPR) repeat protein
VTCPVCGTVAVPSARFCHHCGSALPTAVTLSPTERRVVTVLFGDLSEFTAWSEELDPERVGAVTDRVHAATVQAVTAFGGRVDKLIGDGIMAVFGAPVAHEDDPERAVRAALAMQRAVRRVVEEEEGGGRRLGLRVGINTGPVAAGVQADLSYTVVGDTVNTAARLSDAAGVGSVYAGAATARATRDRTAWRRLPPLRLKGKREPVEAYELLGLRDAPGTRPGLGDEAPFVGREAEFGRLTGRLTEAEERGAPQVVVVTAEPGMGKTRLAAEVARYASELPGGRSLRVRVAPFGDGRLAPLGGLVRQACGVERGDDPDRAAEKVRRVVARLSRRAADSGGPPLPAPDLLLDLIGAGVAGGAPSRAGSGPPGARASDPVPVAVAGLLSALAAEGPLLVVVDDLHNAAPETVEALGELTSRLAGPVQVLLLGRPELVRTAGSLVGLPDAEPLPLPPLSGAATARLLRSYLGGGSLPPADETRLLGTAQGNPFYLAELVSLLVEQGKLTGSAAGWQLTPGSLSGRLLSTDLAAVLAARIDALPPAARAALRDASVIGEHVPEGALLALREAAVDGSTELDRALGELVARRMLRRRARGGWAFATELTRQAAYAGVGKADLAERHARLVRWADALPPEGAGMTPGERDMFIADHAERARDLAEAMRLSSQVDAHAVAPLGVAALGRLAGDALTDGQPRRAARFVDRAEALAGGALSPEFTLLRARAWGLTGRYAEALRLVVDLLADPVGDDVRAGCLLVAGEVHRATGDTAAAAAAWTEVVSVATESGLPRYTAEALRRLGMLDYLAGRVLQAEERFSAAYQTALETGDRPGQGWALQHLAWAATSHADFAAAEDALLRAATLFAEQGDAPGRSWVSGTEAFVRLLQGRLDEARRLAAAFLPFGERAGDQWGVAALQTVEAFAAAELGELTHAESQAKQALRTFTDAEEYWGQSLALVVLGVVARGRGDTAAAVPLLEEAVRCSRLATHPLTVGLAATVLGYAFLDAGNAPAAEDLATTTLEVLEPLKLAEAAGVGPVVLLAQARRAQGDLDRALDLLAEVAVRGGTPSLIFPRRQALAHYAGAVLEAGRVDEAVEWAGRAQEVPAEDVRSRVVALRALASARAAAGDLDEAREAAQQAQVLAYATEQVSERPATDAVVERIGNRAPR